MRFLPLLFAGLVFLSDRASAQAPILSPSAPGVRRSATPPQAAPKGSQSKESAEEQKARFENAVAVLKTRIGEATDKLMNKIIVQEKDLRMRLGYFEKPERVDPTSFGSKEEIQSWQKLADELQQSRDLMAKIYGNASEDLETVLVKEEHISPTLAQGIRKEIISSFPWDDIAKKNELITTYTGYHRQLLAFFDQNWKTWNPQKPYFTDTKLESDYEKLSDQIKSTGKEIETIYTKINF